MARLRREEMGQGQDAVLFSILLFKFFSAPAHSLFLSNQRVVSGPNSLKILASCLCPLPSALIIDTPCL